MRTNPDFTTHVRTTTSCAWRWIALSTLAVAVSPGCGNESDERSAIEPSTGGETDLGTGGDSLGGIPGSGGALMGGASTGDTVTGTGGVITGTGGTLGEGGVATGGAEIGGAETGSGGMATGGVATGGAGTGGVATGGLETGGVSAGGGGTGGGGVVTGGVATGGVETGGAWAGGGAAGGTTTAAGPCDIYESGDTPCVAAHSTVRSLYGSYSGSLYQVRRASDGATLDIGVLSPGGLADSATQDAFCANATCTISIIYDQSPQHNDLTLTEGGWIGDRAKEADATGVKITVGGHPVYGIHVPQADGVTGVGYRNNEATGTAEGDEPESMYMVVNGRYYNDECCFDYGNAERNSLNNGNGTMEAIYFGNATYWGRGDGDGPWVMADLENGLFSGQGAGLNANDKSIDADYVTAMIKGEPHVFAIKVGDAQTGPLTTMYEGAYPDGGYDPMQKEGAIVLGTGGDNSFMAVGDFFEGVMTTGYASDAVDEEVQASIVAAGYGR